jgi:hypothetical protein
MRQVILALVCLGFLGGSIAAQGTKPPAKAPAKPAAPDTRMTNADIIQMAGAGLSEQVIVGAIKQAAGKNFDLTPMGLVNLKKAGVSDSVIVAMQGNTVDPPAAKPAETKAPAPERVEPPKTSPAPAKDSGGVPATVIAEDGVYLIDGVKVTRMEAKAPYQTRTGSTAVSRLTLGIKKAKLNAMLPGLAAEVITTRAPQFYVHLADAESIGDYYLVQFTPNQGQGRRQLEVGSAGLGKAQAGFAEKDLFLVEAKRIQKDIYTVTPKVALSAGEYALLVVPQATSSAQTGLTPRKIFDFGVR